MKVEFFRRIIEKYIYIYIYKFNKNTWFQASASKQIRTALLWVITRRLVTITYRLFWTTYRSFSTRILDSLPLKMRLRGCSETSVRNYHYSLRNDPEEHSSLLNKNSSSRSGVFLCGMTDGRTKMTQLIVAFRNFEKVPNNYNLTEFKQFFYVTAREVSSGCRKL